MIDDLAHLAATVLGIPAIILVGMMLGIAVIDGLLTGLLWPWRNRQ